MDRQKKIVVVCGPTASGKTALGVALAIIENAASPFSLPGVSPAATTRAAAVVVPQPSTPSSAGAFASRDVYKRQAYKLLGLQSFFTAGEMEVKAWTVRQLSLIHI